MILDEFSHWLQSQGVHPVLGGMIFGFLLAKIFSFRLTQTSTVNSSAGMSAYPISAGTFPSDKVQITQTSLNLDAEISQQIAGHLAKGNKIEAIKILRGATGLGLAEAKSAVEGIEASLTKR